MHIIMRSIFNLDSLRKIDKGRVAVLIDEGVGVDAAEYIRLLRPWRSWLKIDGVIMLAKLPAGALKSLVSEACQAVVVVSEREDLVSSVRQECELLGLACVDGSYPACPDRNLAMQQEVAHHDFEIGGVNEWDGQPTQYARQVLQHLSQTHCERYFPKYALPDIKRLSQERGGRPLEAIDIGCGPISRLRWGALQRWLSITGVDPLLNMYRIVLERHGLLNLPEILCQRELCISAEELSKYVAPGSYDFAFSCNAIDHTEDPPFIVSQVAACLGLDGVFALESNKREGTRNNWAQLHQFDIYFGSDGQLLCQSRDGSVRPLIGDDVGLALRDVVVNDESYIVVLLERE